MRLRVRGFVALAACAAVGAAAPPPDAVGLPPDTLLLLVAPWCGPCWGELTRLSALNAAAAPLTVRVLVMEDGARAAAMIADVPAERRWTPADRAAVRASLWARTPGLPFGVVTDHHGRICAETGGGLDVPRVRALVEQCRAPSPNPEARSGV